MSTIDSSTGMNFAAPRGYTVGEIAVRAGRRFGMTNEQDRAVTGYPIDRQYQDQLMEAVNSGYRRFIRDYDRWRWLRAHVQITLMPEGDGPLNINADSARYRLPPGIESSPIEDWTYITSGSDGTKLRSCDFDLIRRQYATTTALSGRPYLAAVAPLRDYQNQSDGDQDSTAWQLIVYPRPTEQLTIEARFAVHPPELVKLEDRHMAGAFHDMTIISAVQYELALMDETMNAGVLGGYLAEYQRSLAASIKIDEKNGPRYLGTQFTQGVYDSLYEFRRDTSQGITSVGGIPTNP